MNASDIIKKKQNTCLYRAYYNPVVYQSTIFSTLNEFSSISSGTSTYTSTVNTVNTYICPPHIISYNLINDIQNGKFTLNGKLESGTQWKNTNSTVQYYYSTSVVTSSYVLRGPEPSVCPDMIFNTYTCGGNGNSIISGENSSDVVAAKRYGTLYNAYYMPSVFASTTNINIVPYSSISSGTTSYTSTSNIIYTYDCNPTFISYELANDVNNGAYVCGNKQISELEWKNTTSTLQLYFSTSGVGSVSTITSTFVMRGPGPIICPLVQFYQGVKTCGTDCEEDVVVYYDYIDYIDSGY